MNFCEGWDMPLFSIQFLNFTQNVLSMKTENISLYDKMNNMPVNLLCCISVAIPTVKNLSLFHRVPCMW